jgi:hypothetical protein
VVMVVKNRNFMVVEETCVHETLKNVNNST